MFSISSVGFTDARRGKIRLSSQTIAGIRHYLNDASGNVRGLLDAGSVITDTSNLEAFGEILQATGNTPNPYQLHGQHQDDASDLYYMRERWYDPRTGQFIGMDPQAGDVLDPPTGHRFLFSRDNPVGFSDPTGEESIGLTSLTQSIGNTIEVRPPRIQDPRTGESPELLGSCQTCAYVVERIKTGTNLLLPAICSDLREKSPQAFAKCHEVLNALNRKRQQPAILAV